MKVKNSNGSDLVIERIKSAVDAGLKIKVISDGVEDLSYFRVASVINPESYRKQTRFTDREVREINRVLDNIKNAL